MHPADLEERLDSGEDYDFRGAFLANETFLQKPVLLVVDSAAAIAFSRVVVGDCAGGEGDAMTQFANGWDVELAAERARSQVSSQTQQMGYLDARLLEAQAEDVVVRAVLSPVFGNI